VLLAVRGLPAFLYRTTVGPRRTIVAALLQATSLPFIVAAAQIGMDLGTISKATGAALIGIAAHAVGSAIGLRKTRMKQEAVVSLPVLGPGGTKPSEGKSE